MKQKARREQPSFRLLLGWLRFEVIAFCMINCCLGSVGKGGAEPRLRQAQHCRWEERGSVRGSRGRGARAPRSGVCGPVLCPQKGSGLKIKEKLFSQWFKWESRQAKAAGSPCPTCEPVPPALPSSLRRLLGKSGPGLDWAFQRPRSELKVSPLQREKY